MIPHESSVKQSVLDERSTPKTTFTELTTEKLNVPTPEVGIGQPAAASIGTDTITAGQTEIVIETTAVTADSRIFITTTTTIDKVLSVATKVEGESFTVTITSPVSEDIQFNWWVVN